jgi:hypothetical protein
MMEIDQAVLENLMMVVPFGCSSALLDAPGGQERFARWCAESPIAQYLMESVLCDAPVFELDDEESIFILSVDYGTASALLACLVGAYEDATLANQLGSDETAAGGA